MNSNLAKAFVLAVAFQAASAMANSPDVLICPDEGCSIITCNDETCTVWNCSGGQCSDVGNFPNPNPGGSGDGASGSSSPGVTAADRDSTNAGLTRSQDAVPLFGPVGGLDCRQQRCAVKTCNELQCALLGFDSGSAVLLGRFNNEDVLIDTIASDFIKSGRDDSSR